MTVEQAVRAQLRLVITNWETSNSLYRQMMRSYHYGRLTTLAAVAAWDGLDDLVTEIEAIAERILAGGE